MQPVRQNLAEFRQFREDRFNPVALYGTEDLKVIAACFREGQFIPVHTPAVDVVFVVIDGRAEIVAGDERWEVGVHDLVVVPAGQRRGIRALTELTVLHVVQPAPSEADHAEVHSKLSAGSFE